MKYGLKGHGRSQKALLCLEIHINIFLFKFYSKPAIKNRNHCFFYDNDSKNNISVIFL